MRALIVDGYNAIHAWPSLRGLASPERLQDARARLIHLLSGYAGSTGVDVTVVFDSHNREGSYEVESVEGITVMYGTAAATADHVIERLAYKATRGGLAHDVIVATTDNLQREIVVAMGVGVMRTLELYAEVQRERSRTDAAAWDRARAAEASNRVEERIDPAVRARLERMRRGEE